MTMDERRIMYVCTDCADGRPECCGYYDRCELAVMPDGRWLCESCFEEARRDLVVDEDDYPPLFCDMPHPLEYVPAALDEEVSE